ncbi:MULTISPECIES: glutamine-hydrolyzing carbamoyl-phosphate synthase small subunit [unclassified Meiothermus]|uniref:glutamine-hydrolyzing carbamoyl-phosphate synthase small subunit n=1 Tax=unclassified Meiothermus TaxID=370471 RepID=UPI000D7BDFE0|nr:MULTISPECIES: glutamine-hydrolyzing carbamoyl-phosphate synthase small subunit [unclassified Meiothermus]PZA08075.1 carbamoyl phosphate synthase small subunit [Meiothermus sp. Pnk-1]RYM38871.1 carbamoyl-phosphate synthase small subunit [Meiothermus sp. PNK-Is4]
MKERAVLVLEDGTVYHGYAFGHRGKAVGEVVFNTAQTGYQETLTDPSYNGQIVVMTYPHQGNYGVNVFDMESNRPWVRGFVAKEFSPYAAGPRAQQSLAEFMEFYGVVGLEGIDTRALVRKIREGGVLKGVIAHASALGGEGYRFSEADFKALQAEARSWTDIDGRDMTPEVSTPLPYAYPTLKTGRRIVVMDFGIKLSQVKYMAELGFEPIVVPGKTTPAQIMALEPQGLFVSNGPGDPSMPRYAHDTLWKLMGLLPTFGICLGHQMLALAAGGRTFKMKFGHRGANHPVKNLLTGKVEITSQNHGYAVDIDSLREFRPTHINLNDGTLEGMAHLRYPVFSVQYHPEASPGPHDSVYLFRRFLEEVEAFHGVTGVPVEKQRADKLGV